MASCPVCLSQVEITSQHFGTLYTCPSCQAVFFVGWDGLPEVSNQENETVQPSSELEGGFPEASETPEQYAETIHNEPPPFEEPANLDESADYKPIEAERSYDFSRPLDAAEAIPDLGPTSHSDTPDFSDVSEFANQEQQLAALNYTVVIQGIDTAEVRMQLKDALTDSKLGWQADQILAQIKGGVLTIKSVNPVKASIIVQRVKYLPVQISWRQDVLSNP